MLECGCQHRDVELFVGVSVEMQKEFHRTMVNRTHKIHKPYGFSFSKCSEGVRPLANSEPSDLGFRSPRSSPSDLKIMPFIL